MNFKNERFTALGPPRMKLGLVEEQPSQEEHGIDELYLEEQEE
jgi:hypothetical protein